MSHDLPPALLHAIDRTLEAGGRAGLRAGAAALSGHYRKGGVSQAGIDLSAYLAARLPATYAAVSRVLAELAMRIPDFTPGSLLDAGAGPGTASWAAALRYPSLQTAAMLDNNPAFQALAVELAADAPHAALAAAQFIGGDIADPPPGPFDLVIAAYALAELPEARVAAVARTLWKRADGVLIVVEPGTPQGFARIRRAREAVLGEGGFIAAPCPHGADCPLPAGDWCHFAVRLARRRLHMQAKGVVVPFEDENYSYLIASRRPVPASPPRVLAPPRDGKAEIRVKLCTAGGLAARAIARRDRDDYKRAKKLTWGGVF